MSVLVNGMEMPKNCWSCRMFYNCYACEGHYCRCAALGEVISKDGEVLRDKRRDDCPLTPVPPHGDLIGREWLIDIALHLMNTAKNEDIANGVKWLWQYIIEAPTIIPAEEGE